MSRRRNLERSSNSDAIGAAVARTSILCAIETSTMLAAYAGEKLLRLFELHALGCLPAFRAAGKLAAPGTPDEIVEQDENPPQPEQRIIGREPPVKPGVGAVDLLGRRAEPAPQRRWQASSGVEHEIGRHLHRIIPAEVLKVEE